MGERATRAATKEPAAPVCYKPTEKEAAGLGRFRDRLANRKPRPRFKVHSTTTDAAGKASVQIAVDHQDAETGELLLHESLATTDPFVASFLTEQLAWLCETDGSISQEL